MRHRSMWLALLGACGEPAALNDAPGAVDARVDALLADAPPPGEPDFETGARWGRIELMEVRSTNGAMSPAEAHAVFVDAPTTWQIVFYGRIGVVHWHAETMRMGECRLLQPTPAFCSACAGVCVATEVCEPYPGSVSRGDLTFTGLQNGKVVLPFNGYWYASQAELGIDAFADDAVVSVSASGATPFIAEAAGVTPLVDTISNPLTLATGAGTTVSWTPNSDGARVRLRLNANNDTHGGPYGAIIECDSPDDGAITIDAALIDAFPPTVEQGACEGSDCPPSTITRYRRTQVEVDGAMVDWVVGSRHDFWLLRP